MSISESLQYPYPTELTSKQQKLLDELRSVVCATGIEVRINEPFTAPKDGLVSLDVEHNESGGFVGCGLYSGGSSVSYYSSLVSINSIDFHALRIIAHNGVSDIDILNEWGINVSYKQLIWDTMLIGHILDSSCKDYGLKGMARRELGMEYPSYDDIVGKRGLKAERCTLDKQPLELVSLYNAMDCIVTWKLYELQRKVMNVSLPIL